MKEHEIISQILKIRGISKRKLAEILRETFAQNLPEQTLYSYLSGTRVVPVRLQTPIAKALGVAKNKIFTNSDFIDTEENECRITLIGNVLPIDDVFDKINVNKFDTEQTMFFDKAFLKTEQAAENLRVFRVRDDSMTPRMRSDSFVVFDITKNIFSGDGLYVILWQNIVMVKLLQGSNFGNIEIVSVNKEYKSYTINQSEQNAFMILGKVARTIV